MENQTLFERIEQEKMGVAKGNRNKTMKDLINDSRYNGDDSNYRHPDVENERPAYFDPNNNS
jgi:hypothetical protein